MAKIIKLPTHGDSRGMLTVVENVIPYDIKRIYYIYNTNEKQRGGHRHKKTIQTLICVKGSCTVFCDNGKEEELFELNSPDKLLIVSPEDWHTMQDFTSDAVLLVISSEHYDRDDYIDEPYKKNEEDKKND